MKRFLSVDWDFFIDADADFRSVFFPDGGAERFSSAVKEFVWNSRYSDNYDKLMKVGVKKKEYRIIRELCRNFYGECMIAENHKHAYDFITERAGISDHFEVYNIDFHHDLYMGFSNQVDCGNWASQLMFNRLGANYFWIGQDDSDVAPDCMRVQRISINLLEEVMSFCSNFFDGVFLCRSDMWSPPHLDSKFIALGKSLSRTNFTVIEQGVLRKRPIISETEARSLNKVTLKLLE